MFRPAVRSFSLIALLAALITTTAQASQITESFPTDQSSYFNGVSISGTGLLGHFSKSGAYITETYSSTGLSQATSADWTINFDFNGRGPVANIDLLVNGTVVGSSTLDYHNSTLTVDGLSFSAISGPDYTLEINLTSDVPPGNGYFVCTGGSVTLYDGVAAVPEPSTLATGLIGVAGAAIAAVRRRRVARKS